MKTHISRRADLLFTLFIPLDWQWRSAVHLPDGHLMWQWHKTRRAAREWVRCFRS